MAAPALDHLVVAAGPRIRLRLKYRGDAADDYAWRRDPELARFDARAPLDEPFSEFLVRFEYDLRFESPDQSSFAIETHDGEHIGNVMYYGVTSTRESAELGITIGRKEFWSKGYGREAIVVFLRYVWETTPFRKLVLHAVEWNERATRCFAGAGFEVTGRIDRQGEVLVEMEARREWWLLHDGLGRFPVGAAERAE